MKKVVALVLSLVLVLSCTFSLAAENPYKWLLTAELDKQDVKYTDGSENVVGVTLDGENADDILVIAIFDKDGDNDVTFYARPFDEGTSFNGSKLQKALDLCNTINRDNRFIRAYIEKDGNLWIQADTYVANSNCGVECWTYMLFTLMTVDEYYNDFASILAGN